MSIFVLGASYHTAPVEILEKLSVNISCSREMIEILKRIPVLDEHVVLSTCNRIEIYGTTSNFEAAYEEVIGVMNFFSRIPKSLFANRLYHKRGEEAVSHLFTVASGLDSMVMGENQILGQVKKAYIKAGGEGTVGRILNPLFQKSLHVGKKVRTETGIGQGRVSVGSITVELAGRIFRDLEQKTIMLIGSGEMSRLVAGALSDKGVKNILVSSRNSQNAVKLVETYGGERIAYDRIDESMKDVDIVIASTSSRYPIVARERVIQWMRDRRDRSLFMVDLGVPRNIKETCSGIKNVFLYNMDDLKTIAQESLNGRCEAAAECDCIIQRATRHFMDRLQMNKVNKRQRTELVFR